MAITGFCPQQWALVSSTVDSLAFECYMLCFLFCISCCNSFSERNADHYLLEISNHLTPLTWLLCARRIFPGDFFFFYMGLPSLLTLSKHFSVAMYFFPSLCWPTFGTHLVAISFSTAASYHLAWPRPSVGSNSSLLRRRPGLAASEAVWASVDMHTAQKHMQLRSSYQDRYNRASIQLVLYLQDTPTVLVGNGQAVH